MTESLPARTGPRVILALDFLAAAPALALAERLDPGQCRLKVGKALFTAAGPALVEALQQRGFEVFLDLKFHDIPNTVAEAVRAAAGLGVWMVNVHASGGRRMLEAAAEACAGAAHRPLLIAVTVLTSMDASDLAALGQAGSPAERVLALTRLTLDSGLDGVVCGAPEAPALRAAFGPAPLLVTPGIRCAGDAADDQRRVVTPVEALRLGSDYLVMGRSLTGAADPVAALAAVNATLHGAVSSDPSS